MSSFSIECMVPLFLRVCSIGSSVICMDGMIQMKSVITIESMISIFSQFMNMIQVGLGSELLKVSGFSKIACMVSQFHMGLIFWQTIIIFKALQLGTSPELSSCFFFFPFFKSLLICQAFVIFGEGMVKRRMAFLGLACITPFIMFSSEWNRVSGDKQAWLIRSDNRRIDFRSDNVSESKSSQAQNNQVEFHIAQISLFIYYQQLKVV